MVINMHWKDILKRISERELLDAKEFAEEDMERDVSRFYPDVFGGKGLTTYLSTKQIKNKEFIEHWKKWIESHSEWINEQTGEDKRLINNFKDDIENITINNAYGYELGINRAKDIIDKLNLNDVK